MSSLDLCSLCEGKCVAIWVMEPCSHGACRKCLASNSNLALCSSCRQQVGYFRCPGSDSGCKYRAKLGTWKEHERTCTFLPVECPYQCDATIPKKMLSRHINSECPLRLEICRHCADNVVYIELDQHEGSCPEALVSCSYCHEENIKRGHLPEHARTCEKTPKPCPLKKYGCRFVGLDTVMEEHLSFKNHISYIEKLEEGLEGRDKEIARLRDQVDTLRNEVKELGESSCSGFVPFDEELKWTAMVPDLSTKSCSDDDDDDDHDEGSNCSLPSSSSRTEQCTLTSPIYKHRGTKATFFFELTLSTQDNGEHIAVLHQRLFANGNRSQSPIFVVNVVEMGHLITHSDRSVTKLRDAGRKEGLSLANQNILSWSLGEDTFGGVTCIEVTMAYCRNS